MTEAAATIPVAAPLPAAPARTYAELLAAAETQRRDRDDLLLRKMTQPRDPMNPASASWGRDALSHQS